MKTNKYEADIKSVLDINNNPNYSITNKQWFQESELAEQIKQETNWVNDLNPDFTLNQRIVLIRDNITDFKECLMCNSKIKFKQQLHRTSDFCSKSCVAKSTLATRVVTRRENSKDKKCINYRLLKYPLECYNYKLKNNKPHSKRFYGRLLVNYLWNEYKNLDLVTKALLKYSKQRIFNIIKSDLSFLITEYEKEYNLDFHSTEIYRILKFEKEPRLCPHCSTKILTDNKFCSVLCSNQYKSTDETYLANLSNGVKDWYKTADTDEIQDRHNKIKKSAVTFYNSLTLDEKKQRQDRIIPNLVAFNNLQNKLNTVTFLFNKDFYYENKHLPVECSICGHQWDMTKSTGVSKTICRKCNPYEKGKTQAEIFDYISRITFCKMNDKSFLKDRKEIDILCTNHKLAIEYDGLLYHSYGISKYPIFNKTNIDINYHLTKTEECQEKGFQLFHIFENEWKDPIKNKIWKSIIEYKLGVNREYSSFIIKETEKEISNIFLVNNHLEGESLESEISIGIYSKEELISVMEFKRISQNNYEITRMCYNLSVELNLKILQYFEEKYLPDSMIYFSDRRYEDPEKFQTLGFELVENTLPRCFKFNVNENILYNCDYENYKLSDTERIIFDCGKTKFKKIY